ncbi:MAG: hypothetical protein Q8P33_03380 [bacterium]|nr:hypothetical protein [bacterium]
MVSGKGLAQTKENKMNTPQFREFSAAVIRWLPDLDSVIAQSWIDDQGALRDFLQGLDRGGKSETPSVTVKEATIAQPKAVYPSIGEVFELTLEPVKALEMVKSDGYNPEGWQFRGKEITKPETRKFKLVQVGYCDSFEQLQKKLKKHGKSPQGQWREAYKKAFPEPDGQGPVGFADPSWLSPDRRARFPFVRTGGASVFFCADYGFHEYWRWVVEVESSK